MPVKKTNAATNAAIQQGLSVRGSKQAATKSVSKKLPAAPAKKAASAVKRVTGGARNSFTPASSPLWNEDTTLTKASVAAKKHTADHNEFLIGGTAKHIAAFRKATALWAQSKKNIVRNGARVVSKGEWLIAFDTAADSPFGGDTIIMNSVGKLIYREAADSTKLDGFDYYPA